MPTSAEEVFALRDARDIAKADLELQIGALQADLQERGIGGRIADEVSDKASALLGDATELVSESKGVIGGTIGLLALWFFREPLVAALETMLGIDTEPEGYDDDDYE